MKTPPCSVCPFTWLHLFEQSAATFLLILTACRCPAADSPPSFPDATHVDHGCYISTAVYLARFGAAFPRERRFPLTVHLATFDGPHTIAVFLWEGCWWGRDEYSGVFPLRCPANPALTPEELRPAAEKALQRVAIRQLKTGRITAASRNSDSISPGERDRQVATAAGLLPYPSTIWHLQGGGEQWSVLFFRPAAGMVAVYDPAIGTAVAHGAGTGVARTVRQIAEHLGYRVTAVQPQR